MKTIIIDKHTGETRIFKGAYCARCNGEMYAYFHFVNGVKGAKLYRFADYDFINIV